MIPEVYGRLRCDPCKSWLEARAQSYFLAGIESRATYAFRQFCKNRRSGKWGSFLSHMIQQFDGADLMIRPFPGDFRSSAGRRIEDKTGFRANLAGRNHNFFAGNVVREAVEVDNSPPLPIDSILGKPGNCIFLALYRLDGGAELDKVV